MASTFRLVITLVLALLPIAGCGGSGVDPGGTSDPFAQNQPGSTPTGNGAVLNYTMSLNAVGSTGGTTVGSNGTVIATATLTDSTGNPVAGQPVRFEEVLPAAIDLPSVTIPVPVVTTSSEGKAISILTANSTTVNRDVILKASTTINGQEVSGISIFTVARSTGNYIEFVTTKEPSDPDGSLNPLQVKLTAVDPATVPTYGILQLVTVNVLDKNGIKRSHIPVTLEVVTVLGNQCSVDLGAPGATTQTVFTDDTGLGIFSTEIWMSTPPIGVSHSCSVVFRASTSDPYAQTPTDLFSYGGYVAMITNNKEQPTTQPTTSSQ